LTNHAKSYISIQKPQYIADINIFRIELMVDIGAIMGKIRKTDFGKAKEAEAVENFLHFEIL
jgi:hypothetical protein